jgi:hypothetical protein
MEQAVATEVLSPLGGCLAINSLSPRAQHTVQIIHTNTDIFACPLRPAADPAQQLVATRSAHFSHIQPGRQMT